VGKRGSEAGDEVRRFGYFDVKRATTVSKCIRWYGKNQVSTAKLIIIRNFTIERTIHRLKP
jgi:hypothetical protein